MPTDYEKYRGKCKEMSEELARQNLGFEVVKGWYTCPIWGRQEHWWCKDSSGRIHDETKNQFPSKGIGEYEEYQGICICEECGKEVAEKDVIPMGRYATCSDLCARRLVGV